MGKTARAQNLVPVSTRLQRIAELAKAHPEWSFQTLSHHLDERLLREAFKMTRRDGAPGIDGRTAADYEQKLGENLTSLVSRAKTGTYRAPPVRRVHIPKGDGRETRPIGIPTLEDKVLQRGVAMILGAIYEQDFLGCSYGFRPGRGAHDALNDLWRRLMNSAGCWLIEVDIRKFFDTLDHGRLQEILRRRVSDGVLLRLIGKWLNAGIMEGLELSYPDAGTPQGGVISPLLANVYLHEVIDRWFAEMVTPVLKGQAFLIRYADDFVMGFTVESDARRVLKALPQRLAKYGLTLHPEKTRLLNFRRPTLEGGMPGPDAGLHARSFDFLGFTHHWGLSRQGRVVVRQRTAASRLTRGLNKVRAWCRANRHAPLDEQHAAISAKLRGHYGYFGMTGNMQRVGQFFREVFLAWFEWLGQRSQRPLTWAAFDRISRRFPLPPPRLPHSVYRSANA